MKYGCLSLNVVSVGKSWSNSVIELLDSASWTQRRSNVGWAAQRILHRTWLNLMWNLMMIILFLRIQSSNQEEIGVTFGVTIPFRTGMNPNCQLLSRLTLQSELERKLPLSYLLNLHRLLQRKLYLLIHMTLVWAVELMERVADFDIVMAVLLVPSRSLLVFAGRCMHGGSAASVASIVNVWLSVVRKLTS